MRTNRLRWIILIAAILLAPIAWYLVSPLFITRTVDEAFPEVIAAAPAQEMPADVQPTATIQQQASPTSLPPTQVIATPTMAMTATPEASQTEAQQPTLISQSGAYCNSGADCRTNCRS